jgi:uncharacterized protein (TIGR02246 family)
MTGLACAPVSQQGAEIEAASAGWEAALNAGDVEAIVAHYTDEALLMPPNGEMGQGADAVRAAFTEMVDAGLTGKLPTIESRVAGDIGYRVGTYVLTAPDGTQVDKGKYIETWRKVGGEWKIDHDIWNSDLPAGAGLTRAVFTHEVEDFAHWYAAWTGENSRHGLFAEHGAPEVTVYQNAENPNQVALTVGIENAEAFHTFMQSPEVAAAKAEDGVVDRGLQVYMKVE